MAGFRRLFASAQPVLLAVAAGAAGGLLFSQLGLPLPWMIGSMLATTVASMTGARAAIPASWRGPTIAVLGVLLGSAFTADVARGMGRWIPTLLALVPYTLLIGLLALVYLRTIAKLDARTAYFCASPGGLSEMVILGDRAGGDMRTIGLVHGTRILLVVLIIPFGFSAFGYDVSQAAGSAGPSGTGLDLTLLAICGGAGWLLGRTLRLPAPGLLGPMLVSASAHLADLVHGAPPYAVVSAAQLLIGASVGCRFAGYPLPRVVWMMLTALGLTLLMLGFTLAFAWCLNVLTGLPIPQLVLAFAPGGLAEMSLMALTLTDDPAFVAAHHIVRIGFVVLTVPLLYRLYARAIALPADNSAGLK